MELTGREKIYFTTFRIAVLLLISLTILAVFLNYRRLIVIEDGRGMKESGQGAYQGGEYGGCDTPNF